MELYLSWLKDLIWSPIFVALIALICLYLNRALQFTPYFHFFRAVRMMTGSQSFTKDKNQGISHFQALMTSLAATIGTGNIAGVATAISTGGLGSVFWMWVFGLLSMGLKYSEAVLAVKFRSSHTPPLGGPMYYLEKAGMFRLGKIYAFLGILATLGTGNLVQTNALCTSIQTFLTVSPNLIAFILILITGSVLFGGAHAIARLFEYYVPAMAMLYIGLGMTILVLNLQDIPLALDLIIKDAFSTSLPVTGGFLGHSIATCLQVGFSRGIFASEAGLGTSSIASASAIDDKPEIQGLLSMLSGFISTIVICGMTGLVLSLAILRHSFELNSLNGALLAMKAFGMFVPYGDVVVGLALILFAYSTMLAWAFYGEQFSRYLFKDSSTIPFRILYTMMILPGVWLSISSVWLISDIINGLMVIPNLIGILMLVRSIDKPSL